MANPNPASWLTKRSDTKTRFILATVMLLGLTDCTPSANQFDLVITNVTLIDGTGAPPRQNVDVIINEGRITQISAASAERDEKKRLAGDGKFLIPGLVDAHTHPAPIQENFPRFVHYGVTSILVTGCGACSAETLTTLRALAAPGSNSAPRVFKTSEHFTMKGRHPVKTYRSPNWVQGETVYFLDSLDQIDEYIETVAKQPIVGIKVTIEDGPEPPFVERIPTEFVSRIVEVAHSRGLQVYAHVSDMDEVNIAAAAGVDHLVHFVGVDIDWERDGRVIESLRERDLSWITTLMIDKSFFYPSRPDWLDAVEQEQVFDAVELDKLRSTRSPQAALDFLREIYGVDEPTIENVMRPQLEDLAALHRMGFNLVIGTDTGNRFVFPGLSMHEEMQLMGMAFEPLDIITMATRNAAKMLGKLDEIGTIEVGKRADMVLLHRNPLEDIAHTRAISNVIVDGQIQETINPGTNTH